MQKHPVLLAAIDDTDSRRPRWIPNNIDPPFDKGPHGSHPIIDSNICPVTCASQVAEVEDGKAQGFDLAHGPLWRVGFYQLRQEHPVTYFVALTIHHVVTDRMGALNIFEELMRQSGLPTGVIPPKQPLPPKAENTMRIQPSAPMTIKRGARWILNHKSSQKVTHGIGVKTMWPLPSRLKPSPGKPKVRHVQLDFRRDHSRVVERLEALGSQIGSVHSILHTSAVVALAAAASDSLFDTFSTETPVSLRSEKRKHPRIGGNYTGLIERSIPVSSLSSHTVASFTKKFNDYIHSS